MPVPSPPAVSRRALRRGVLAALLASFPATLAFAAAPPAFWVPTQAPSSPFSPIVTPAETGPSSFPFSPIVTPAETGPNSFEPGMVSPAAFGNAWTYQIMPTGLIYRSYLAGEKESRFRGFWAYEKDGGWIWDLTLGGRVGLLRYGTTGAQRPEGFQIDIEGAAMPRIDLEEEADLVSADFRFGIPVTYGNEWYQVKLAFYHLSSHVGDEFLLKTPGFDRLNYSRDAFVFGHSVYATEWLRFYGEVGWAMGPDISQPWEFQFGVEYSPPCATGQRGQPFAAVGAHLREEVDFGGNLVVQTGWAWRGRSDSGLLRIGVEYFNGKSEQFSFFDESESKLGFAVWYDY